MSKKKQTNSDDIVRAKSSQEERTEEQPQQPQMDARTQAFYEGYEKLVQETGKIIRAEIVAYSTGIFPTINLVDVENTAENQGDSTK